jgi:hypothetical protein
MEALLGFHVGFWDYVTFVSLAIIGASALGVVVLILGLQAALPLRATIRKQRQFI